MYTRTVCRLLFTLALSSLLCAPVQAQDSPTAALNEPALIHKLTVADDHLEMVLHSSRILATDKKIARTAVENPDVLEANVLSPTQVYISAKATGFTKINLWDEDKRLYSVQVQVIPDSRELALKLRAAFPRDTLQVTPVGSAVRISGFVDKSENIDQIIQIAEQYYPKVINGIRVAGVQQVYLHIKVMEVSRTKLRRLGVDWAKVTGDNFIISGVNGMFTDVGGSVYPNLVRSATPSTFAFNVGISNGFFAVLNAMRKDNLMKIMSEPMLTTSSGQPAVLTSGGKIPVPTPQSLGTLSIEWQPYGTEAKFVPVVLGNGKIRLDVDSNVSELDATNSTTIAGTTVPGIKSRTAHTSVEMMAGQTLAIAGLVETRIEAENQGLPWVSDVPYLGVMFSQKQETRNEVELLILVTPQLAEPLDPCEVPPCGPGMGTTSPSDFELYLKGHIEVPKCPQGQPQPQGAPGDGPCASSNGGNAPMPTSDGMIGSSEQISAPTPNEPHNRQSPPRANPPLQPSPSASQDGPPGFIGPVGYDVVK